MKLLKLNQWLKELTGIVTTIAIDTTLCFWRILVANQYIIPIPFPSRIMGLEMPPCKQKSSSSVPYSTSMSMGGKNTYFEIPPQKKLHLVQVFCLLLQLLLCFNQLGLPRNSCFNWCNDVVIPHFTIWVMVTNPMISDDFTISTPLTHFFFGVTSSSHCS